MAESFRVFVGDELTPYDVRETEQYLHHYCYDCMNCTLVWHTPIPLTVCDSCGQQSGRLVYHNNPRAIVDRHRDTGAKLAP